MAGIDSKASKKQEKTDLKDELDGRLAMLHAMLEAITGGGHESFSELSHKLRDNYIWACTHMAEECIALSASI